MKQNGRRIVSVAILLLCFAILATTNSLATTELTKVEYTEEYKAWLALSEEERKKVLMPRMYDNITVDDSDDLRSLRNTFRVTKLLKSSLSSSYNLKNIIPENTTIKNQMETSACWAFGILASLESNLAMQDKQNNKTATVYDFSERHLVYATTREAFLNNAINEQGFTKKISDGGNDSLSTAYLTNGQGAVLETEMPFENNEDDIDIKKIQNKTVSTELIETIYFDTPRTAEEKEVVKAKVKEHITNYGGVTAGIHGAEIMSRYYNNATGAIYCNNSFIAQMNHEVLIIGWDDAYSKDNFNESCKPENNGAWIIKNSWGEKQEISLTESKKMIYDNNTTYCNEKGWNSASDIPNEVIIEQLINNGYARESITIEADNLSVKIGDKGYMYISYEDVHVFDGMYGIVKATTKKEYDNIYQYNELGTNSTIRGEAKLGYLANVFDRDNAKNEMLTKIGIHTLMDMKISKVYVNPNGSSRSLSDLQEVTLAEGNEINLQAGYQTIEFANPIRLTGNSFVVAIEVEADSGRIMIPLVQKMEPYWTAVELIQGKSFCATATELQNNQWKDLTLLEDESLRGNLCLKAFTKESEEEPALSELTISKVPNKVSYTEGENFDKVGMKVVAKYTDGTSKEITDYKITNGNNLKVGQSTITIIYTENGVTKTAVQAITVEKKVVTVIKMEIKTKPTKLEYTIGTDTLDLTGGILKVTYSDNTTQEIPMTNTQVTVTGYDKTKLGSQTINLTYQGKTATFQISVKEEKIEEKVEDKPENNTEPKTENVSQVKQEPTPSNFDDTKASITQASSYVYETTKKDAYTTMTIKIEGIQVEDDKAEKEYYYYVSGKQGQSDVAESSWKKVDSIIKESDGTYSITITLDSRNMDNAKEVEESDNLYIYMKETVTLEGNQVSTINTLKAELKTEVQVYMDDVLKGNIETVTESQIQKTNNNTNTNGNTEEDKKDTTTASGSIPQTGIKSMIVVVIIVIGIGIFSYIKIKKVGKID